MEAVSALEAVAPIGNRSPAVAVVAGDEVVRRRATSALVRDGQLVSMEIASPDELEHEDGRRTDTVVIGGCARADQRAAAIRATTMRLPAVRIVVIAATDANGVNKALEAGADGFVLDADLEATLAPTVRAVRAGQVVVPPMTRAWAVRPPLSHREKQTLALLALGLTNAEIAHRLYLAESTVKCHLTSIFSKLGVRSRNEAIACAVDQPDGLGLGMPRPSGDGDHPGTRS
jgi:DNA-binding NarL/FixJ family response regulator